MKVHKIALATGFLDDVVSTPTMHAMMDLYAQDNTDPYIIKFVSGLDADELVSSYYAQGGLTGRAPYYHINMGSRTVSMVIALNPQYASNQTPSDLRDTLYRAISSNHGSEVQIVMYGPGDETDIIGTLRGFITKFEAALFTAEPAVQITIQCKDPIIDGALQLITSGVTMPSPSWTDDISTAPTGFSMQVRFTANVTGPVTIQGVYGTTKAPFVINYNFLNNDRLYFSSQRNDRYLYIERGSTHIDLVDKISLNSIWPFMFPGTTRIGFSTSSLAFIEIRYTCAHWGV